MSMSFTDKVTYRPIHDLSFLFPSQVFFISRIWCIVRELLKRSYPIKCCKLERISLEQLLLVLLPFLLLLELYLLFLDLIFLQLVQHVAKRAIHFRYGPIKAPYHSPGAQWGYLALLRSKQTFTLHALLLSTLIRAALSSSGFLVTGAVNLSLIVTSWVRRWHLGAFRGGLAWAQAPTANFCSGHGVRAAASPAREKQVQIIIATHYDRLHFMSFVSCGGKSTSSTCQRGWEVFTAGKLQSFLIVTIARGARGLFFGAYNVGRCWDWFHNHHGTWRWYKILLALWVEIRPAHLSMHINELPG